VFPELIIFALSQELFCLSVSRTYMHLRHLLQISYFSVVFS